MKSYFAISIFSFVVGLFASLLSYIPKNAIFLLLMVFSLSIYYVIGYIKSNNNIKLGLAYFLPLIKNLNKNNFGGSKNREKEINISTGRVIVEYEHQGTIRYHALPYNRKNLAKHSKYKVYLIEMDNTEIEITQIPGTEYKHTPKDLNGKSIKVVNKISGEEKIYTEEQIPELTH